MSEKLVICTTPNNIEAEKISELLVKEKLVACVNIIPQIISIYNWEDKLHKDHECLMLIKTTTKAFGAVEEKIKKNHSYTNPEIIAIDITNGSTEYLNWVKQNVKY